MISSCSNRMFRMTVEILFVKVRKSSGSRCDPCGTPEQILTDLEIESE